MIRYRKIFEAIPTQEHEGIMVIATEEVDPTELQPYDLVLLEAGEYRRLAGDSAMVEAIRERADDITAARDAEADTGSR